MFSSGAFRIKFEDFRLNAGNVKARGFLPFKIVVEPELPPPVKRYRYGVYFNEVELAYDELRGELGEALDDAAIRWAITQIEVLVKRGRLPSPPPNETIKLTIREAELQDLSRMAREKACAYQVPSGRELFCSAAAADDPEMIAISGLKRLAPTSRAICNGCSLPQTDFICSHLTHPGVIAASAKVTNDRLLVYAFCGLGRAEVNSGSGCHAGGNSCWARIVETHRDLPSAVPFSPKELPVALDYLSTIWGQVFGNPLVRLRSIEKTVALVLPCETEDEFRARLGDLNELFKLMEIRDDDLPIEHREKIKKEQTFARIKVSLGAKIQDPTDQEAISGALDDLSSLNTVRNKLTHGGSELALALDQLGIGYPIRDYASAWNRVREKAAEALTIMRSALQSVE